MSAKSSLRTVGLLLGSLGWLACAQVDERAANKTVVRGYMTEILNEGNFTAVDQYFPPEGFHLNGRTLTTEELPALRQSILNRFPDFRLTIEDQIAEGDQVVTRVTFRGTHAGKAVTYTGIAIDRVVDGKVVEGWHEADQLAMLRQLGVSIEVPR